MPRKKIGFILHRRRAMNWLKGTTIGIAFLFIAFAFIGRWWWGSWQKVIDESIGYVIGFTFLAIVLIMASWAKIKVK